MHFKRHNISHCSRFQGRFVVHPNTERSVVGKCMRKGKGKCGAVSLQAVTANLLRKLIDNIGF